MFGEGPAERRNRLRDLLIARGETGLKRGAEEDEMETEESEEEEEEEKKVRRTWVIHKGHHEFLRAGATWSIFHRLTLYFWEIGPYVVCLLIHSNHSLKYGTILAQKNFNKHACGSPRTHFQGNQSNHVFNEFLKLDDGSCLPYADWHGCWRCIV